MRAVGLPWYSQATYRRSIDLMEDRAAFPSSYEAWLKEAELMRRRVEDDGNIVYRVIIDPEEFGAWCRRQDVMPNAAARERFAALAARRLFREKADGDMKTASHGARDTGMSDMTENGAHGVD